MGVQCVTVCFGFECMLKNSDSPVDTSLSPYVFFFSSLTFYLTTLHNKTQLTMNFIQ